ncbi:MAG: lipase family alpha/beta hydrolase [Planctomycetaceae bacterium]
MDTQGTKKSKDTVVLIHGLGAHRFTMHPLAYWLQHDFSRVINWGYRSLWSSIESHAEQFEQLLRRLDGEQVEGNLHIVSHSMGGIVTRTVLSHYVPKHLGRIVMLAPPNQGSHVAKHLAPWLGRLVPPLHQLSSDEGSYVTELQVPTGIPVGILAAERDFLVHLESTHLPTENDHMVLPGIHSSICWRKETAKQVAHFLNVGRFIRERQGLAMTTSA